MNQPLSHRPPGPEAPLAPPTSPTPPTSATPPALPTTPRTVRFPSTMTVLCRACGAQTRGEAGQVAMCRRCYKTLDLADADAAPDANPPPTAETVRRPGRERVRGRGAGPRAMLLVAFSVVVAVALALWLLHAGRP